MKVNERKIFPNNQVLNLKRLNLKMKNLRAAIVAFTLLIPMFAQAHVTVAPRESMQGATQKYTFQIPAEGDVASVALELEIPEGVNVLGLQVPIGYTYEVTRENGLITTITWQVLVKPGEFIKVEFVARNPIEVSELAWGLKQHFADVTISDWSGGGSAVTRLTPNPQ